MPEKTETKNEPGKFTSEFILVILTNVIAVVGAFKGIIGPEWTAAVLGILNGVYGVIRTWRKNSADKKEVELKKIEGSQA